MRSACRSFLLATEHGTHQRGSEANSQPWRPEQLFEGHATPFFLNHSVPPVGKLPTHWLQCGRLKLSELHPVFSGNFAHLFRSELLGWRSGSTAHLTKKCFQTGRCHHPQQQQLTGRVLNSMPNAFGDIN